MSILEKIKCINKTDEETILIKATRNEEEPPKQKHLDDIIYCYDGQLDYEKMSNLIIQRITKTNTNWIEMAHLLIIILNIIKTDGKRDLIKKMRKGGILCGVAELGVSEKDDLTRAFCKYIDSIIKMYCEMGVVMEENTPLNQLKTKVDWRNTLNGCERIMATFEELKNLHWNNIDLYQSKLTLYIMKLLLKEMSIMLIKLTYYLKTFLIDLKTIEADDVEKIIQKVEIFESFESFYLQELPKLIPSLKINNFPIIAAQQGLFLNLCNSLKEIGEYDQEIHSKMVLDTLNDFGSFCSTIETPLREFVRQDDTLSNSRSRSRSHSITSSGSNPSSSGHSRKYSLNSKQPPKIVPTAVGVASRLSDGATPMKKEGNFIKLPSTNTGVIDSSLRRKSVSRSGKIEAEGPYCRKRYDSTPSEGATIKKSLSFSK